MMRRAVTLILTGVLLSACATAPNGNPKAQNNLLPQMLVMQSNPAIGAFFANEAAAAGVTTITLTDNAGMQRIFGADAIGLTRLRATGSEITYNIERPDGATPQNISHEIAHAVADRSGCDNHGAIWGRAHIAIAQRFEQQFPGTLWAGLSPTDQASEEAALYPTEQC